MKVMDKWQVIELAWCSMVEIKDEVVLKGSGITPHRVEGVASVIRSSKDLEQVTSEDIVVLVNSTPLMVPYLIKAKGFIGEAGGLQCHLAIISREFDKPCIIGIENVTKIIASGDAVKISGLSGRVTVKKNG